MQNAFNVKFWKAFLFAYFSSSNNMNITIGSNCSISEFLSSCFLFAKMFFLGFYLKLFYL